MNDYLIYSVIALVIFNAYVNIRLLISPLYDRFQKIAQSLIIWLLPLAGALIILYLINDIDRKPPPPSSNTNYGNDSMPGGVQ